VVEPLTPTGTPEAPAQYAPPPVTAKVVGKPLTVTVVVAVEPHDEVYVIVVVPAPAPVTTPVERPTVAIAVLALVHDPPVVASVSVVVALTQKGDEPPTIAAGAGHWARPEKLIPHSNNSKYSLFILMFFVLNFM
jgi:hypothetical protein